MRRLSALLGGLILAGFGLWMVAGADGPVAVAARDGLILAAAGASLFAAASLRLPPLPFGVLARQWPYWGRVAAGAGAACAAAAALLASAPPNAFWAALRGGLWISGLGLFSLGAFWPGAPKRYGAPARLWQDDSRGRGARPRGASAAPLLRRELGRAAPLVAVALIAAGLLARANWWGQAVPCIGDECVRALALGEAQGWSAAGLRPFALLAELLYRFSGDAVSALRWAAFVFSAATLALFGRMARRHPGALFGLALAALSPWHSVATRSGEPATAAAFFVLLALAALLAAWGRQERRAWAAAGLALGLAALSSPAQQSGLWLWGALLALFGWASAGERTPAAFVTTGGMLLAGMLVGGAPALAAPAAGGAGQWPSDWLALVSGLLINGLAGQPLLGVVEGAAALAGLALLLRRAGHPVAWVTATGTAALAFGAAAAAATQPPSAAALPLLPLLYFAGGMALDQAAGLAAAVWQPVARPVAVYALLAALAMVSPARGLWLAERSRDAGAALPAGAAAAGYIAAAAQADPTAQFFVQPELLGDPGLRLGAGEAMAAGRVHPLDGVGGLVLARTLPGELHFLAPDDRPQLKALLPLYYPAGAWGAPPALGGGAFHVYRISGAARRAEEGLLGEIEAGGEVVWRGRTAALAFDWAEPASAPDMERAAGAWRGTLLARTPGSYLFAVAGGGAGDIASLRLDDVLILDSGLGLHRQEVALAQGAHRIEVGYHGAQAAPLELRWIPPGGVEEAIPAQALVSPALPELGLQAELFANDRFAGPAAGVWRDPLPGTLPTETALPASIRWRGNLAAARAGEYLLGVAAYGALHLMVDGRALIDAPAPDSAVEGYREALIYLEPGWHELEIGFAPARAGESAEFFWQPPGAGPERLSPAQLLPAVGQVLASDRPLPPPPALADARLGDDSFALSQGIEVRQATTMVPPDGLPALPLTPVWQSGAGCGPGDAQLDRPHGAAFHAGDGRLYVADTGNRRIVGFGPGVGAEAILAHETFEEPVDVVVDAEGQLLVLDATAQRIFVVDPASGVTETLAAGVGFYRPRGLAAGPQGIVLVADTGGGRVVALSPAGETLATFGGPGTPLGSGQPVDVLPTERALWAVTAEDGRLWQADGGGSVVATLPTVTADGPQLAGLADGSFFLSDPGRRLVAYHLPSGRPVGHFDGGGAFALPAGVAAAQAGNWVQLAVVDAGACAVSVWEMPAAELAQFGR